MSNTVETATVANWSHAKVLVKGEIKNAWIVYSSDDKVFVTFPHKVYRMKRDQHGSPIHWITLGLSFYKDGSTGTYEELLQVLSNHIEYDESFDYGVFDQWDNPIPMLTLTAAQDFFFDNFINRY